MMKRNIRIATLLLVVAAAIASGNATIREFWQSHTHSVNDKAKWAAAFFSTNACTFADVTGVLGKPDSTSRTGTEVKGFRMQYDALYRFTNGTIDLVFLLPVEKEKWDDTVLHSVRHVTHRAPKDLYRAQWRERTIKRSQQAESTVPVEAAPSASSTVR